jgi:putative ABC transport system permease protein
MPRGPRGFFHDNDARVEPSLDPPQRAVLVQGLSVTVLAFLAGGAIATVLARSTQALFFDARPGDPRVLAAAALLLLGVAAVASLLPARRASRVELLTVLKND